MGEHKLAKAASADIISANANSLQDDLLKRINPNSLLRNVTVIKAAINCVIAEQSLTIPNMLKTNTTQQAQPKNNFRLFPTTNITQ